MMTSCRPSRPIRFMAKKSSYENLKEQCAYCSLLFFSIVPIVVQVRCSSPLSTCFAFVCSILKRTYCKWSRWKRAHLPQESFWPLTFGPPAAMTLSLLTFGPTWLHHEGCFIVVRVLPIVNRILQTELRINITKIRECLLLLLIMRSHTSNKITYWC